VKDSISNYRGYIIATILGAVGGGLIVALLTRAIPKIMSQMMAGMMQNMMAQMNEEGCNPAEMCQQMMAKFTETQQEIPE
jgi:CheY-specific phosphatase CheX